MVILFTLVCQLCGGISTSFMLYYCNWVLGSSVESGAMKQILVNMIGQAPTGFGVLLLWPLVRKFGKTKGLRHWLFDSRNWVTGSSDGRKQYANRIGRVVHQIHWSAAYLCNCGTACGGTGSYRNAAGLPAGRLLGFYKQHYPTIDNRIEPDIAVGAFSFWDISYRKAQAR